jgi:hypothetical protein
MIDHGAITLKLILPVFLVCCFFISCDLVLPPADFKGPFPAATPVPTPGTVPTPSVAPTIQPDGNLIYNGNFEDGLSYWWYWVNPDSTAAANIGSVSGVLTVDIIDGSDARWHIQVGQNNLVFVQNKIYRLTFDGRAQNARDIQAEIGENNFDNNLDGSPYSSYASGFPVLSTTMQSFSIDLPMTQPTDIRARFLFDLGSNPNDVFIDNVKLIELP